VFMALLALLVPERSAPWYLAYLPGRAILAFATLSAAYSMRHLSEKLLRGTDISYGIYIYHSVVINVIVQLGLMNSILSVASVYGISIMLALLSWFLIEKPALACKSLSPSLFASLFKRREQA
jgi:peptidoglycan/LPS O-acetylase OafA/YrhL